LATNPATHAHTTYNASGVIMQQCSVVPSVRWQLG